MRGRNSSTSNARRVKDHWYHARLLENMWAQVMNGYEESLKDLETRLGDDHNLVVLYDVVGQPPSTMGDPASVSSTSR